VLLFEVDHLQTRQDLPGAVAKAQADIPAAEQASKDAVATMANAEVRRNLLSEVRSALSRKANALAAQIVDAKKAAMLAEVNGRAAEKQPPEATRAWREYHRMRDELQQVRDTLVFTSSWLFTDAVRDCLVKSIAERHAYCDLVETRATAVRLDSLLAARAVSEKDPGVKFDWGTGTGPHKGSNTSTAMAAVDRIRSVDIKKLESDLATHDERTEKERDGLAVALWK